MKYRYIIVINLLIYVLMITLLCFDRHLQWFWGASGDYWQKHWIKIHEMAGGSEIILAVFG